MSTLGVQKAAHDTITLEAAKEESTTKVSIDDEAYTGEMQNVAVQTCVSQDEYAIVLHRALLPTEPVSPRTSLSTDSSSTLLLSFPPPTPRRTLSSP